MGTPEQAVGGSHCLLLLLLFPTINISITIQTLHTAGYLQPRIAIMP
jgi:hypothetical protein